MRLIPIEPLTPERRHEVAKERKKRGIKPYAKYKPQYTRPAPQRYCSDCNAKISQRHTGTRCHSCRRIRVDAAAERIPEMLAMREGGATIQQIIDHFYISTTVLYRLCPELRTMSERTEE